MRQISKWLVKRYVLVALIFACFALAGLLLYTQRPDTTNGNSNAAASPSKVIVSQASVVDQGVQLNWLEAQPGDQPITGYIIERSRSGGGFEQIARVEGIFSDYLDDQGAEGDLYRVIAGDSGGRRSPAGEPLAAVPPRPGSVVAVAPGSSSVLGASSKLEQAETPAQKAETLQNLIEKTFGSFDAALDDNNDKTAAPDLLQALQNYQRQALRLWPQLTAPQKAHLAQICTDNLDAFKANLHALPEDDQFDGTLAAAGCHAMQEGAQ